MINEANEIVYSFVDCHQLDLFKSQNLVCHHY